MKLLLMAFSLFWINAISFAQKPIPTEVTGLIIDKETNQPLEYVTLIFQDFKNPNKITGGITDSKGRFKIDIRPGKYNISIEFISYETHKINEKEITSDINLGKIAMEYAIDQLKTVEIIREKTTVEVKLDKKIYNIGKDLTAGGSNVADALGNVPSVTVDVDGTVSLRGNENVRILINGKPSALVGNSTDVLSQLPADAIDKVEVITSPSARYDAEGTAGILNIILKKEKTLGFNGTVNLNLGYPTLSKLSTNLNYRTDKFNLFTTLGQFYREPPGNIRFENTFENGDFNNIIENREITREDIGYNVNVGLEYFINDKSSVTGSVFGRYADELDLTKNESNRFLNNNLSSIIDISENVFKKDKSLQTSLNYIHNFNFEGHKLSADFQYSYDDEKIKSDVLDLDRFNNNELVSQELVLEKEIKNEFLIQADYVLPMGNSQFEAGFRGTYEQEVKDFELQQLNLNTNSFELVEELTNNFTYNENTSALYSQYGNKLGKFSFLLGLRMEYTQLKGKTISDFDITVIEELLGEEIELNFEKDYLEPFPTVNLIYEINDEQNITLGYNRRINRPRGFFINPFPSRSTDINIFQGNPGLFPSFSGAFDLGYLKKWNQLTVNASIYYQNTENSFEVIREETEETTDQGISIIRSTPINLSTSERFGTEMSVIYNPIKWIRMNWSLNAFKFVNEGFFNDVDFGSEDETWFTRFSAKVTLPKKIDWQTNFTYRGKRETAQTEFDARYRLDLALSKEIFNEKATVSFNVRDLLNSRRRQFITTTDSFTTDGDIQFRERQFTLTFLYRINQKKEKKKGGKKPSSSPANSNGEDNGSGF